MNFNWQCAIGLHPWSKWEALPPRAAPAKADTFITHAVHQKRECPECGKVELRSQTT